MDEFNDKTNALLESLRIAVQKEDEELTENLKQELITLGMEMGKKHLAGNLRSLKAKEKIPVQWELEEIIDVLDPPKVKEVVEDDPSKRQLRSNELIHIYQDPRGLSLFASKVDGRWVVMQMDPRTGGIHRQEIPEEGVSQIKASIPPTSPYWLVDPMSL